jgi:hypothetical protein
MFGRFVEIFGHKFTNNISKIEKILGEISKNCIFINQIVTQGVT